MSDLGFKNNVPDTLLSGKELPTFRRINSIWSGQGVSVSFSLQQHFQKFATVVDRRYKKNCQ